MWAAAGVSGVGHQSTNLGPGNQASGERRGCLSCVHTNLAPIFPELFAADFLTETLSLFCPVSQRTTFITATLCVGNLVLAEGPGNATPAPPVGAGSPAPGAPNQSPIQKAQLGSQRQGNQGCAHAPPLWLGGAGPAGKVAGAEALEGSVSHRHT